MRRSRSHLVLLAGLLLIVIGALRADDPGLAREDQKTLTAAQVGTGDKELLDYFRKASQAGADQGKIRALIAQLGDDAFDVREKASAGLLAIGQPARAALEQAAKSPDPEVARRAEECLHLLQHGAGAAVPAAAARQLARRRPAGATEALLAYLPYADNQLVEDEVRAALAALAVRDGRPDTDLVAALSDTDPLRRGAAVQALAGTSGARPAVAKLIHDPNVAVRLRAALGLARAGDKDAVPVLIELLAQLPPEQAWPAEDMLMRLAGDDAPAEALGRDEASRLRCRRAWSEWWTAHGKTLDVAEAARPHLRGYTLLVLAGDENSAEGRALEVDAAGKTRWEIKGLRFPLDAQSLPGNRVLLAEYGSRRVTERTPAGDVIWQKSVDDDGPVMAQRLPNGDTFIATKNRLMEVDRAGKELWTHVPPTGEQIMKARKLDGGEVACLFNNLGNGVPGSRYVRMTAGGRELASFPVQAHTFGGRLDVLPNGHVMVPEKDENRVIEYDVKGDISWQAAVEQPIAAVRLDNGNTLVTLMQGNAAQELDRAGKPGWQYHANVRINRAFRR
jgi:hypothetical protein